MAERLNFKDLLALGLMTFALFIGAGNIIFPPFIGLQSGQYVWISALGFLVTAVGLPITTLIAIARVGGNIHVISAPIGRKLGLLMLIICYLMIGPCFAIPRTAVVSFLIGITPFTGENTLSLLTYSIIYFLLVSSLALYPHRLLEIVGLILAPLKIIFLFLLGITAILYPADKPLCITKKCTSALFSTGMINGYLTMDALGALVFGVIIINAIRSRGITNTTLQTQYTIVAGIISCVGLSTIYIMLFRLGSTSAVLVPSAKNGIDILDAYADHVFGTVGSGFLTILVTLACLVTAVGLTCASATFFQEKTHLGYKSLVFLIGLISILDSNLGLDQLTKIFIPVLACIYPPYIVLVLLSFTTNWWNHSTLLISSATLVSLVFSCVDNINMLTNFSHLQKWISYLPFNTHGLSWLLPTLITLIVMAIFDQRKKIAALLVNCFSKKTSFF